MPEMTNEELGQFLVDQNFKEPGMSEKLALIEYQKWWNIPPTGVLDSVTKRSMELPRFCAHPDKMNLGATMCKWKKKHIKWCVSGSLPPLTNEIVNQAVRDSFDNWANVGAITHEQVFTPSQADILITTGTIDGPSKTLAWCELPCSGADVQLRMKIDVSEKWVVSNNPPMQYISLIAVITHELGHGFGLEHTSVANQLMNPYYNPLIMKPQKNYDIEEFVKRYGPKLTPPTPPIPGGEGAFNIAFDPTTLKFVFNGKPGKVVWE